MSKIRLKRGQHWIVEGSFARGRELTRVRLASVNYRINDGITFTISKRGFLRWIRLNKAVCYGE